MNLSDITSPNLFILNSNYNKKDEILRTLVKKLHSEGKITSKQEFLDVLYSRETLSCTGMEGGIAIPHGKSNTVLEPTLAIMTTNSVIDDWESLDPTNKVQYIFLLAIPEEVDDSTHLDLLTELMSRMNNSEYREKLFSSQTAEEFYENIDQNIKKMKLSDNEYTKTILAITACPIGLAHTYMASESLIKAGNQLGVKIIVEKQGANGIDDRHTPKIIKKADAVIFATDIAIRAPERFAHLPKIEVPVAEPIKDGISVIKLALNEIENTENQNITIDELDNINHKQIIKKSIFTGISYIIPLIIAGGMFSTFVFMATNFFDFSNVYGEYPFWFDALQSFGGNMINTLLLPVLSAYIAYSISSKTALIAGYGAGVASNLINGGFLAGMIGGILAGYIVFYMKKIIPAKGTMSNFITFWVYPVLSTTSVALLMIIVIGKPISLINHYLVNFLGNMEGKNAVILGIIIGIMVSFDLGGPINKAAYTFCIGAISEGILMPYAVFASVKMVSGFAITFATSVTDVFLDDDIELGKSTWILALAGITEGAIPFMLRDPINVIFSMCVGSAFTGGLLASFGIGLDIPGAGIFSIFVLTSTYLTPFMAMVIWFFSALLGAIISAFLLVITRKRKLKLHNNINKNSKNTISS